MTTPVSRVPALALALSLVALSACDKEKAAEGEAKSEDKADKPEDKKTDDSQAGDTKQADASVKTDEATPDAAGDTATPPTPTPTPTNPSASGGDGAAYFAINQRGIAKLDANGWSMVVDKSTYFSKMFLGADNNVYIADFDAIKKIDGNALVDVAKLDHKTFSGPHSLVLTRDASKFFAVAFNKYGVFEAGNWKVSELKDISPDIDNLKDIALADDGTVWISSSKHLLHNTGGTWTAVDTSSLGEHFFMLHLSNSPTGEVFATNGQELIKVSAEKLEKIEFKAVRYEHYGSELTYNDKGLVLAAAGSCELIRLDPAKPTEQWSAGRKDYNCLALEAAALDGQDRAWVYSHEGLSVIGPDKTVTEYPTGTVMEIVGTYIGEMLVVGNGPPLPAAGPAHTGTVTGKALIEGTAVANAKIEMCGTPAYGASQPCYESKVKFSGTTNDKGEFTFENVPIGPYGVAVEIEGKWQISYLSQVALEMKEGASYDVGGVKFSAPR